MVVDITDKMLAIVQECRVDLKVLEQCIEDSQDFRSWTEPEYEAYLHLLHQCHEDIRNKIHLLATMLETDSAEILEMVQRKQLT